MFQDGEENAYAVLGIGNGPDSTESDLRKAYRKLALQKHPDKNPDNPRAAQEFAIIQKAYDILCDKEAREALDDWIRLQEHKAQRTQFRDEKRRRMAQDLERREKEADAKVGAELAAKERLQQQIERLRRAAAEREEMLHRQKQMSAYSSGSKQEGRNKQDDERLSRTVKVNWDPEEVQLDEMSLRHMLTSIGAAVEDVVIRRSKKRKKEYNSALVVMGSANDCKHAVSKLQSQRGVKIKTLVDDASIDTDTAPVVARSENNDGLRQEGGHPPLFPAAKSRMENPQGVSKAEDANATNSFSFEQQVLARMMRPSATDT